MAFLRETLTEILKGKAIPKILRFLWQSQGDWSGREIARHANCSAPSTHEALKKLLEMGLVSFRRVSNIHLYALNKENYWVREVLPTLFRAESNIKKELVRTIREKCAASNRGRVILSVSLFGSVARGDEKSGSDVDLFIIYKNQKNDPFVDTLLADIKQEIFQRFGLSVSPYKKKIGELRRKSAKRPSIARNLLKESELIYGKSVKELL